jgi:hypothetical protein
MVSLIDSVQENSSSSCKGPRAACCADLLHDKDGRCWCVLHYQIADRTALTKTDTAKLDLFEAIVEKRLEEGDYRFQGVWFPNSFDFGHVSPEFRHANFNGAHFTREAYFKDVSFVGSTNFKGTFFEGECLFDGAKFRSTAEFQGAQFSRQASFSNSRFSSGATFENALFKESAFFENARFSQSTAEFKKTIFLGRVSFAKAHFESVMDFFESQFSARVDLSEARIDGQLFFRGCKFDSPAGFSMDKSEVANTVKFPDSHFLGAISLNGLDVMGGSSIDFSKSVISKGLSVHGGTWHRDNLSPERVAAISRLFWRVRRSISRLFLRVSRFISCLQVWRFLYRLFFRQEFLVQQQDSQEAKGRLSFAHAKIYNPETVTFHGVRLTPSWFADVDVRKVTFRGVSWYGWDGEVWSSNAEIEHLAERHGSDIYDSIAATYRELAINANENHRYEEASLFRFAVMDVPRHRPGKAWNIFSLHWWYWLMSGYGERVGQAFLVLIIIVVGFSFFYRDVPFGGANLALGAAPPAQGSLERSLEALLYSARTASLREPIPPPPSLRVKSAVAVESILAPIQAALLLLAVRRHFSRSSDE